MHQCNHTAKLAGLTSLVPSDTTKENWSACFSSWLVWRYWTLRDTRSACVNVLILVPADEQTGHLVSLTGTPTTEKTLRREMNLLLLLCFIFKHLANTTTTLSQR